MLVHGVSADSATWASFAERLAADGWRVVAPDLRGHGDSRRGTYALTDLAGDLVESLPPEPDLALGHSLGGAVLMAALPRLRPRRAVYADPAWRMEMTPAQQAAGRQFVMSATREQWGQFMPRVPDRDLDALLTAAGKWDLDAFAAGLVSVEVVPTSAPSIPSLLMLSSTQVNFDVDAVERLGYQVERLPDASHFLFWEEAARCAAVVTAFVAR